VPDAVDIFVSYAREDEDRAGRLVRALEACGWRVFWDRTIPPGETWRSHIGVPLDQASVVLVVWSHHSIEADFVHSEANRAKTRGALVPILFDDVAPPLGFEHIHAADLIRWVAGAGAALPELLVRTLERRLAQPARTMPTPAPQPEPQPAPIRAPPPVRSETPRPGEGSVRRYAMPFVAGVVVALAIAAGVSALAGSRSDSAGAAREATSLREQLRGEARARQEAEDRAKAASARIAALEKELRDAQAARTRAEAEARSAATRADTAEASVTALRREIETLRSARPSAMPTTTGALICRTAHGACELETRWRSAPVGGYCWCQQGAVSGGVTSVVSGTVQVNR